MRAPVILGACLILGCGALSPARADTDAEKLAVVREMLAAWHALDWEKVYALFAEDGVLHSMMMEPVIGRDAIRERLGRLTPGISRIDLKVRAIGVIDGLVFVERVDDFVHNGHAGAVPVVGVLEVEGGKVKAWREYYDRAQLLREMGVQPRTEAHP
jgi:limonene-1,2-epoxide hydrolase